MFGDAIHIQELERRCAALREALNVFVKAAYPVSSEINPRGWNWCEAYLDHAREIALPLLED